MILQAKCRNYGLTSSYYQCLQENWRYQKETRSEGIHWILDTRSTSDSGQVKKQIMIISQIISQIIKHSTEQNSRISAYNNIFLHTEPIFRWAKLCTMFDSQLFFFFLEMTWFCWVDPAPQSLDFCLDSNLIGENMSAHFKLQGKKIKVVSFVQKRWGI